MGFVPNSILTMAHMRQLPVAFSMLFGTVMGTDVKVLMENLIKVAPEQNAPEKIYPQTCFSSSLTALASPLDVATAKLIPDTIPRGLATHRMLRLKNSRRYCLTDRRVL